MISIRRLSTIARGALLAIALGGLTVGGVAMRPHTTAASGPSTLRIWYSTDDPAEQTWIKGIVQHFNATHRNIHAALTTYGLDDFNQKMQLALSSGTPPDLMYATPRGPGLPAYLRAGKLMDLTHAAKAHDWAKALRPGLLADYNALLAAYGSARDAGHIYAVPYAIAAVGVLYNKTIFHKLGLRAPRTFGEMASMLPRLKRAGYTPLGFGNADGWIGDDWYLTLVNAAVDPSSLTGVLRLSPSFSFKGSAYYKAAATLQNWANQNYFTHGFGGLDAQDAVNAFFEGKTAMQLISSSENSQILSLVKESKLDVGVFPFPSARANAKPVMPQSGYEGWAIPTKAHNPSAAIDFITTMVSGATAETLLSHGMIPAHAISTHNARTAAPFQRDYITALDSAVPGVYLDSAPIPNLNATMEANVQLLLQNVESPSFLSRSLDQVYASRGAHASSTRTDGEF